MQEKKIIHMKIPMIENSNRSNDFAVSRDLMDNFLKTTKLLLPQDYILIASPFDTTCIDGDATIINIDCKEYSYNELMEVIEKANMYDGLNK